MIVIINTLLLVSLKRRELTKFVQFTERNAMEDTGDDNADDGRSTRYQPPPTTRCPISTASIGPLSLSSLLRSKAIWWAFCGEQFFSSLHSFLVQWKKVGNLIITKHRISLGQHTHTQIQSTFTFHPTQQHPFVDEQTWDIVHNEPTYSWHSHTLAPKLQLYPYLPHYQ